MPEIPPGLFGGPMEISSFILGIYLNFVTALLPLYEQNISNYGISRSLID